jgi:hypothetical protein
VCSAAVECRSNKPSCGSKLCLSLHDAGGTARFWKLQQLKLLIGPGNLAAGVMAPVVDASGDGDVAGQCSCCGQVMAGAMALCSSEVVQQVVQQSLGKWLN